MNTEAFDQLKDLLKDTLIRILETEFIEEDREIAKLSITREEDDTENINSFMDLLELIWNSTVKVTEDWERPVQPIVFREMLIISVDMVTLEGEQEDE